MYPILVIKAAILGVKIKVKVSASSFESKISDLRVSSLGLRFSV